MPFGYTFNFKLLIKTFYVTSTDTQIFKFVSDMLEVFCKHCAHIEISMCNFRIVLKSYSPALMSYNFMLVYIFHILQGNPQSL